MLRTLIGGGRTRPDAKTIPVRRLWACRSSQQPARRCGGAKLPSSNLLSAHALREVLLGGRRRILGGVRQAQHLGKGALNLRGQPHASEQAQRLSEKRLLRPSDPVRGLPQEGGKFVRWNVFKVPRTQLTRKDCGLVGEPIGPEPDLPTAQGIIADDVPSFLEAGQRSVELVGNEVADPAAPGGAHVRRMCSRPEHGSLGGDDVQQGQLDLLAGRIVNRRSPAGEGAVREQVWELPRAGLPEASTGERIAIDGRLLRPAYRVDARADEASGAGASASTENEVTGTGPETS
jgi:hypothetical protein